jgi:hypothetical protein
MLLVASRTGGASVYDFIYIAVRDRREKSPDVVGNKGKPVLCLTGEDCKFVKTVNANQLRVFSRYVN